MILVVRVAFMGRVLEIIVDALKEIMLYRLRRGKVRRNKHYIRGVIK
jgi:hypothetical protein